MSNHLLSLGNMTRNPNNFEEFSLAWNDLKTATGLVTGDTVELKFALKDRYGSINEYTYEFFADFDYPQPTISVGSGLENYEDIYSNPLTPISFNNNEQEAIAWYRFEDSDDPIIHDKRDYYHGFMQNMDSQNYVSGRIEDKALQFNGIDEYVNLPDDIIKGTMDFSVSLWFKTTSTTAGSLIAKRDLSGVNGEFELISETDGKVRFYIYNNGYQFNLVSTDSYNDGNWHHIVALRERGNGLLCIDNEIEAIIEDTPIKAIDSQLALTLGTDMRNNKFFEGTIDECIFFDFGLSRDQVTFLYSEQEKAHQEYVWWDFEKGLGDYIIDYNAIYNGTIMGELNWLQGSNAQVGNSSFNFSPQYFTPTQNDYHVKVGSVNYPNLISTPIEFLRFRTLYDEYFETFNSSYMSCSMLPDDSQFLLNTMYPLTMKNQFPYASYVNDWNTWNVLYNPSFSSTSGTINGNEFTLTSSPLSGEYYSTPDQEDWSDFKFNMTNKYESGDLNNTGVINQTDYASFYSQSFFKKYLRWNEDFSVFDGTYMDHTYYPLDGFDSEYSINPLYMRSEYPIYEEYSNSWAYWQWYAGQTNAYKNISNGNFSSYLLNDLDLYNPESDSEFLIDNNRGSVEPFNDEIILSEGDEQYITLQSTHLTHSTYTRWSESFENINSYMAYDPDPAKYGTTGNQMSFSNGELLLTNGKPNLQYSEDWTEGWIEDINNQFTQSQWYNNGYLTSHLIEDDKTYSVNGFEDITTLKGSEEAPTNFNSTQINPQSETLWNESFTSHQDYMDIQYSPHNYNSIYEYGDGSVNMQNIQPADTYNDNLIGWDLNYNSEYSTSSFSSGTLDSEPDKKVVSSVTKHTANTNGVVSDFNDDSPDTIYTVTRPTATNGQWQEVTKSGASFSTDHNWDTLNDNSVYERIGHDPFFLYQWSTQQDSYYRHYYVYDSYISSYKYIYETYDFFMSKSVPSYTLNQLDIQLNTMLDPYRGSYYVKFQIRSSSNGWYTFANNGNTHENSWTTHQWTLTSLPNGLNDYVIGGNKIQIRIQIEMRAADSHESGGHIECNVARLQTHEEATQSSVDLQFPSELNDGFKSYLLFVKGKTYGGIAYIKLDDTTYVQIDSHLSSGVYLIPGFTTLKLDLRGQQFPVDKVDIYYLYIYSRDNDFGLTSSFISGSDYNLNCRIIATSPFELRRDGSEIPFRQSTSLEGDKYILDIEDYELDNLVSLSVYSRDPNFYYVKIQYFELVPYYDVFDLSTGSGNIFSKNFVFDSTGRDWFNIKIIASNAEVSINNFQITAKFLCEHKSEGYKLEQRYSIDLVEASSIFEGQSGFLLSNLQANGNFEVNTSFIYTHYPGTILNVIVDIFNTGENIGSISKVWTTSTSSTQSFNLRDVDQGGLEIGQPITDFSITYILKGDNAQLNVTSLTLNDYRDDLDPKESELEFTIIKTLEPPLNVTYDPYLYYQYQASKRLQKFSFSYWDYNLKKWSKIDENTVAGLQNGQIDLVGGLDETNTLKFNFTMKGFPYYPENEFWFDLDLLRVDYKTKRIETDNDVSASIIKNIDPSISGEDFLDAYDNDSEFLKLYNISITADFVFQYDDDNYDYFAFFIISDNLTKLQYDLTTLSQIDFTFEFDSSNGNDKGFDISFNVSNGELMISNLAIDIEFECEISPDTTLVCQEFVVDLPIELNENEQGFGNWKILSDFILLSGTFEIFLDVKTELDPNTWVQINYSQVAIGPYTFDIRNEIGESTRLFDVRIRYRLTGGTAELAITSLELTDERDIINGQTGKSPELVFTLSRQLNTTDCNIERAVLDYRYRVTNNLLNFGLKVQDKGDTWIDLPGGGYSPDAWFSGSVNISSYINPNDNYVDLKFILIGNENYTDHEFNLELDQLKIEYKWTKNETDVISMVSYLDFNLDGFLNQYDAYESLYLMKYEVRVTFTHEFTVKDPNYSNLSKFYLNGQGEGIPTVFDINLNDSFTYVFNFTSSGSSDGFDMKFEISNGELVISEFNVTARFLCLNINDKECLEQNFVIDAPENDIVLTDGEKEQGVFVLNTTYRFNSGDNGLFMYYIDIKTDDNSTWIRAYTKNMEEALQFAEFSFNITDFMRNYTTNHEDGIFKLDDFRVTYNISGNNAELWVDDLSLYYSEAPQFRMFVYVDLMNMSIYDRPRDVILNYRYCSNVTIDDFKLSIWDTQTRSWDTIDSETLTTSWREGIFLINNQTYATEDLNYTFKIEAFLPLYPDFDGSDRAFELMIDNFRVDYEWVRKGGEIEASVTKQIDSSFLDRFDNSTFNNYKDQIAIDLSFDYTFTKYDSDDSYAIVEFNDTVIRQTLEGTHFGCKFNYDSIFDNNGFMVNFTIVNGSLHVWNFNIDFEYKCIEKTTNYHELTQTFIWDYPKEWNFTDYSLLFLNTTYDFNMDESDLLTYTESNKLEISIDLLIPSYGWVTAESNFINQDSTGTLSFDVRGFHNAHPEFQPSEDIRIKFIVTGNNSELIVSNIQFYERVLTSAQVKCEITTPIEFSI
ncbi:MAG: LamG domain-containing protein [Candidatus Lokiarchaeota archaeon]